MISETPAIREHKTKSDKISNVAMLTKLTLYSTDCEMQGDER
jgi:hypothetical protein